MGGHAAEARTLPAAVTQPFASSSSSSELSGPALIDLGPINEFRAEDRL